MYVCKVSSWPLSLFVQLGASPREDGVTTATRSWAKENVHTQWYQQPIKSVEQFWSIFTIIAPEVLVSIHCAEYLSPFIVPSTCLQSLCRVLVSNHCAEYLSPFIVPSTCLQSLCRVLLCSGSGELLGAEHCKLCLNTRRLLGIHALGKRVEFLCTMQ